MFRVEPAEYGVTVRLTGDVDLMVRDELLNSYAQAIALMDVPHILVDVSGVTFMDSTGLCTLVTARNKVLARGGTISVTGASERIIRLFQICHLDEVITLLPADQPPLGRALSREEVG